MTNHDDWADMLASDSPEKQAEALRLISGQDSVTGLTVAITSLSGSSDDEVRTWAAEALETAVEPTAAELTALIELLDSAGDGEICYWSATMLGRLGNQAGAAVAALARCLRESDYLPARERATWALRQIGPPAAAAIPALKAVADQAPPRLQRLATEALRAIDDVAA